MILYGRIVSPYVMRPLLAARAKGHDLQVEMFEGGIKSEAYLAHSPMGRMPLLIDGDLALPESQTITDYLDAVLDGPAIVPADPKAAARMRLLIRLVDVYVLPHLNLLFSGDAAAKQAIATGLGYIEHFRRAGDIWAFGNGFTMADAALIPVFFFFDAMDDRLQTRALLDGVPGLAAWWARARVTDVGQRCIAEQAQSMKEMFADRAAAAA